MSDTKDAECLRNCWLIAVGGGALVLLMMWLVGTFGFFTSLIMGAILAAALGVFLVWAFCTGTEATAFTAAAAPSAARLETGSGPAPRETSATPATTATPAKAPDAAPAPAASLSAGAAEPVVAGKADGLGAALAKSKTDNGNGAPEMLAAPRGGRADDLKRIKGIGPKLEKLLNEIGVWHFDQIASWKAKDIAFVDEKLEGFKGRVTRDGWVRQAKLLANGGATEFSDRVAKGGVYGDN